MNALTRVIATALVVLIPAHTDAGITERRGGGLVVHLPGTAAGMAIADAFVARACGSYTVHPDGRVASTRTPEIRSRRGSSRSAQSWMRS